MTASTLVVDNEPAATPISTSAPYNLAIGYLRAFITLLVLAHHSLLAYILFVPASPASLTESRHDGTCRIATLGDRPRLYLGAFLYNFKFRVPGFVRAFRGQVRGKLRQSHCQRLQHVSRSLCICRLLQYAPLQTTLPALAKGALVFASALLLSWGVSASPQTLII